MTRDLLWALRWLRRNPLFSIAAIAILALGIGANTAVFSIVDAALLRPLPYPGAERLVRIVESSTQRPVFGIPLQDFQAWRGRTDLFDTVAANLRDIVTVTGAAEPEQLVIQRVSDGMFSMVHARAELGRALADSDNAFGAPNAAVLSDHLWRRSFHADPSVVGRAITVADEPYTIVGVMPPDFEFPSSDAQLWVPLRLEPSASTLLEVAARMRPDARLPQVQSAMAIVARQYAAENPARRGGLRIEIAPWRETVERKYELTLIFVLAAVGLVLLIACADVGSLLLTRAVERRREIAIRASLGAGFWRVARQLAAESLVLTVCGSAAGVLMARYVLRLLTRQIAALPLVMPHLQRVSLNGRVLLFNAALCLVLAGLCSMAPVLLAARTDLQSAMRAGQGVGGSPGARGLFAILIGAETAFAFLLLAGSGLMVRSLVRLQQTDHGFHPDHVLTLRVPIGTQRQPRPAGKYDTKPRQIAYYRAMLERLQRVPGLRAVALANNIPLSGANTSLESQGPNGERVLNSARTISAGYFSAMGIPLVAGRTFTDGDDAAAPPVVIVNEYMARQLYPGRDPIGLKLPSPRSVNPPVIVGVVKDTSQTSYEQPVKAEVYMPYQQFIFGVFLTTIVVRTPGDPMAVAGALRKAIWEVDINQPVVKVETMNDVIAQSIWRPRFAAWIFSILGGLALILTSAGVYSVVSYTSTLRAKEIGIRVALGASPRGIVALIMRGAFIPMAAGLMLASLAAILLSRLMASLLYELSGADPATYAAAAVVLVFIGVIASARPAIKMAANDPLLSLRME